MRGGEVLIDRNISQTNSWKKLLQYFVVLAFNDDNLTTVNP